MSTKDTTDRQREEPIGSSKTFAFSARPPRGLTEREAAERRARGLGNDAKVGTGRTYLQILRENVFTFFNIVLFSLATILLLLGSPRDAFFTGVVALFNVSLATFQEIRAKRKLDRIALLTRPTATVLREEVEKVIDPTQVVIGDLVIAGPGDQIIVDGAMVGDSEAEVDESLLTGEADPVPKRAGDAVSSGSFVLSGRVLYEAQQVGGNSFAARLTESARAHKSELTPLQQEVNLVIRVLLAVVFFFGLLIALNLFLSTDVSLVNSVRAASVVFGLTPSSLFLTIVVAYAIGAVRIAGQGALVQRSNAIESLTHVSVLCLDKTGTLTSNRIKFERLAPLGEGPDLPGAQHLREILGIYARSCTAGNRTSEAIVAALPGHPEQPVAEVLFASDRKWSALAFEGETLRGLYTLGAPEVLIPHLVDQTRDLDAEIGLWSAQGLRVLLFAGLPTVMPLHDAQGVPQLPEGLIPLGLLVLSDELRPDARETLAGFAEAGIRLKIISGDNPHTVEALARQAGMAADGAPLVLRSGPELAMLDEAGFQAVVRETTIFGRITPEQKQRIVRTLREQGEYVAMTGDGVNDVLALKQARLGIAMQSGSQAARSVADIILLNDSFAALPQAFLEGQRILNGMADILKLYLSRVLSLALIIATIAMLAAGFPYTPAQSSVVSLLSVSLPAFALTLWARPGRVPHTGLVRRLVHFVLPAVIWITAASVAVYLFFMVSTEDWPYTQSALTYTSICLGLLLIIFAEPPAEFWVGGDQLTRDWRPTLTALILFLILMASPYIPLLDRFFGLDPLRQPADYLVIGFIVLIWVLGLRFTWRARLIERYLNIEFEHPEPDSRSPAG